MFPKFRSINLVIQIKGMLKGVKIVLITLMNFAIFFEKESAFLEAYTFGKTSPKSRIKKVTKIT